MSPNGVGVFKSLHWWFCSESGNTTELAGCLFEADSGDWEVICHMVRCIYRGCGVFVLSR